MSFELGGITFYTISEACKLAHTNRNTFLRWVREGKVRDVGHRDRNGWRLFTAEEMRDLRARVTRVETVLSAEVRD